MRKINWNLNFVNAFLHHLPLISAHSGEVKLYLPSIIFRNMTICLRCQNGGQPTSNVNIMTPHAQLKMESYHKYAISNSKNSTFHNNYVTLTYQLPLSIRATSPTYYISMFLALDSLVFHTNLQCYQSFIKNCFCLMYKFNSNIVFTVIVPCMDKKGDN